MRETSVAVVPWSRWKATAPSIAVAGVRDVVAAAAVHVQVEEARQQPGALEVVDGRVDRRSAGVHRGDDAAFQVHPGIAEHSVGGDDPSARQQPLRAVGHRHAPRYIGRGGIAKPSQVDPG